MADGALEDPSLQLQSHKVLDVERTLRVSRENASFFFFSANKKAKGERHKSFA